MSWAARNIEAVPGPGRVSATLDDGTAALRPTRAEQGRRGLRRTAMPRHTRTEFDESGVATRTVDAAEAARVASRGSPWILPQGSIPQLPLSSAASSSRQGSFSACGHDRLPILPQLLRQHPSSPRARLPAPRSRRPAHHPAWAHRPPRRRRFHPATISRATPRPRSIDKSPCSSSSAFALRSGRSRHPRRSV